MCLRNNNHLNVCVCVCVILSMHPTTVRQFSPAGSCPQAGTTAAHPGRVLPADTHTHTHTHTHPADSLEECDTPIELLKEGRIDIFVVRAEDYQCYYYLFVGLSLFV